LASTLQRRVILRMADEADYSYAGMPSDVLGASSPAGRGMLDERELQVGILGTSPEPEAQARAIKKLASSMRRAGVAQAPRIQRLPERVQLRDLPALLNGQPVLGLSAETLSAFPFSAQGAFVVAGPPGSGRTTALAALCASLERVRPQTRFHRLAVQPSLLDDEYKWASNTLGIDDVAAAALDVTGQLETDSSPAVVVIESLPEFLSTPADMALQTLIKSALRAGHLVLAEGEISAMSSMYPLLSAVRSARAGLCLQPDQLDGSVFKTDFPRCRRADFPPGRGFYVQRGKVSTVQIALPDTLGVEP
jgi:S-DNA-T family DNA segregation ATPase FtsK/SpoIIIE